MNTEEKAIEIPFGANDSELIKWEYTIPKGMEAEIKDGKVIIKKAESEDEKIRKFLIDYFTSYKIGNVATKLNGYRIDGILAYLEKQKEQKPKECFTCDEYKKGYEAGRLNGITAGYNKAMKEVEQKEPKPVVTHGETYRVDTLGTQQVIAGKMPQKPAEWSEEDEKIRKALIWHLKADVDFVSNGVTKAECIAYLDKQKAQKQEWSDEDKRILKGIIGLVDHNQHYNVSNKEMLAWLKSLRPVSKEFLQPHWKPSEEQMRALLKVVDKARELHYTSIDGYDGYNELRSLYEQIKKLM